MAVPLACMDHLRQQSVGTARSKGFSDALRQDYSFEPNAAKEIGIINLEFRRRKRDDGLGGGGEGG